MQVRSTYRYAKISAFQGARSHPRYSGPAGFGSARPGRVQPEEGGGFDCKTLKSAVANAENNANLRVDGLVVKEATVGEGPTMKRMMPRARGSGSRILKRTSHIRIILTDEIEIKTRDKKKGGKKTGARRRRRKQKHSERRPRRKQEQPESAEAETKPKAEGISYGTES